MARIVVIESTEQIRAMLFDLLTQAGYHGTYYATAPIAEACNEGRSIDVVIADTMEGLGWIYPDTPILILSGKHLSGDKIKALDAGASVYLTKPFVDAELLAYVRRLLATKQRLDELAAATP